MLRNSSRRARGTMFLFAAAKYGNVSKSGEYEYAGAMAPAYS
jgi:hypothetical protein